MSHSYAELHCLTNFTFLRGASHAEELVTRAAELDYAALALTDECSLASVVRAHVAAKAQGLKLIVGSEFRLADGLKLVLLAMNREGYGHLSQLITTARRRSAKGEYVLAREDLADGMAGCVVLWVPEYGGTCSKGDVPKEEENNFLSPHPTPEEHAPCVSNRLHPCSRIPEREGTLRLTDVLSETDRPVPGPHVPDTANRLRPCILPSGGKESLRLSTVPLEITTARWLTTTFPERAWIAVELHRGPHDREHVAWLEQLSRLGGLPLVAAGDVHMHIRGRRALQDTLTAIRLGTTLEQAGLSLYPNGERHLRPGDELARLYRPEWLAQTLAIAARCTFSLDELRYEYPLDDVPPGESAALYLRRLTLDGMRTRWPDDVPPKVVALVEHELEIISAMRYEPFFLTVHDIVRYARSRGILCQGRGSAANSAVCYCLGITAVDPSRSEMLFERFVSKERDEPPDIDVDFEHERREEVIQYIYQRYGRERAALAASVITYRRRSALRDVGKTLGLSLDQIERLSGMLAWWDRGIPPERVREAGLDPDSPLVQQVLHLADALRGFPRHLSQHVGGFVISRGPLAQLVPIENAAMEAGPAGALGHDTGDSLDAGGNIDATGMPGLRATSAISLRPREVARTVIQWDKDDLEAMGLLKVDVLALGMLSALRRCLDLLAQHRGRRLTLADIPAEDPATYAMIQKADTLGVFQIESRAQMTMLPRLKPACFYDLVIEVAIVRPGPIQGDMVHPYLRRRQGLEPVSYPNDAVRGVLERTLGVPIFQEQVIKLAMVAAGFSAGEADGLRRAMAAWKRKGGLEPFERKLKAGMRERGYSDEFAERIYQQILGFGEYGFPESHSASFALLAYVSAWLKCHEPAAFACALLNSQPMGFYAPSQIVQDVRRHGVEVRSVDVLHSDVDCTLETNADTISSRPFLLPQGEGQDEGGNNRFNSPHPNPGPYAPGMANRLHPCSRIPEREGMKTNFALRLGLRMVKSLSAAATTRIVAARRRQPFASVADLAQRAQLERRDVDALAVAGALATLAGHRRQARWQALGSEPSLPLFEQLHFTEETPALQAPSEGEDLIADYASTGLTLGRHPLALLRAHLRRSGNVTAAQFALLKGGRFVRLTGLVTTRQHPGAGGTVFLTLEDETGVANIIVWKDRVERYRREVLQGRLLEVRGRLQKEGAVLHLIAARLIDRTELLGRLQTSSRDFH
jgi:error-prone DNA polymerase